MLGVFALWRHPSGGMCEVVPVNVDAPTIVVVASLLERPKSPI